MMQRWADYLDGLRTGERTAGAVDEETVGGKAGPKAGAA